jgi:hypothetical protein
MRLQEGIFQLERLKKEMKELPPGDQKKFDSDIEKGLSDAGVSWIHKEKKEKKTIKREK